VKIVHGDAAGVGITPLDLPCGFERLLFVVAVDVGDGISQPVPVFFVIAALTS